MPAEEIDHFLHQLEEPKRTTLEQLRRAILGLLRESEQGLSYGVPAFRVDGKVIAGFSAAKNHLSYLPHSGTVLSSLEPADLDGLTASKGALKFTIDTPLPGHLVTKLITARLTEIAD